MNYLAHIYLSNDSTGAILGAMLGDFVKGDDYLAYPPAVSTAIMLHRQVDAFTDSHPIVSASKRRLDPVHRHTKGIIIDIFYDHILATNWGDYCDVPLEAFTARAYAVLKATDVELPPRMENMLPYMVSGDWLTSYREIDGTARALGGLSRRLKVPNKLAIAIMDLRRNYSDLEADFRLFFPELQARVEQIKASR